MQISDKILSDVIALQAHFASGLEKATTLRAALEGELNPSPRALSKLLMADAAVEKRNRRLNKRRSQ